MTDSDRPTDRRTAGDSFRIDWLNRVGPTSIAFRPLEAVQSAADEWNGLRRRGLENVSDRLWGR